MKGFKASPRSIVSWLVVVTMVFAFSGVTALRAATTLKLGFVTAADPKDPYYIASKKWAELIEKYTHGKYKVALYPSGQLGNESDMIRNIMVGTQDLGVITNAPTGSFVSSFMVLDMPFIFPSYQVAHKVLDGPTGKALLSKLDKINIKGLAFAEGGFRHMINNVRPIRTPADLKGIKFRVMKAPVYLAMFKALGANAVPMPWGEVFTAVQQHVVDGLEIPIPVIWANKFYEVTKYLSLTGHTYSPLIMMVSGNLWKRLSKEDQAAFQKAAIEAARYERQTIEAIIQDLINKLKAKGMIVNQVPDKRPFMEMVKPVYKQFEGKIGKETLEMVLKARDEAMATK